MPKLMDLFVDIVLNAGTFEDDLTDIKGEAQSLAEEIDSLNKAPEGVTQTKLTNVMSDAATVKSTIADARQAADDVDSKVKQIEEGGSSALSGLLDTFAGVAELLVESVVAGIFEVGAESIEMAASADSPLANAYNKAAESLTLTQDLAKMEIGNALLPVATSIKQLTDNILSFAFNISDADKLTSYLDQLETYEAENLARVASNLQGVFGAFEQINRADAADFSSMSAGVVSQTRFWTDYANTLESLKNRGIDTAFLADIADGSYESLEQLLSLESLSDEDLNTFMASYEQLTAAREAAAESISASQVAAQTASDDVVSTVAGMVAELDQSDMAALNMGDTMDAIIAAIGERIPALRGQVDTISALAAEITAATAAPDPGFGFTTNMYGSAFGGWNMKKNSDNPNSDNPKASGLDYVPYDGYKAELHRGEKILTRQQAEEFRKAPNGTASVDPSALAAAFYDALSRWGQPVGANAFGAIISPQISQNIATGTKGRR